MPRLEDDQQPTPAAVQDLDRLPVLPWRNRLSVIVLLGLSALNAFNDNILKMQLVGLAPKVEAGSLGQDIGLWLGAIILLPYILFAPLAGWISDRFSKRHVILAMLILQAAVLAGTGLLFHHGSGRGSLLAAMAMFLLLALQSTLYSPAKMGILKELAGSRRLGMVSGWLQMMTMAGILGGLTLGGPWFDRSFAQTGSAWEAAARPVWTLLGISLVAMLCGWLIQRVPSQSRAPFRVAILWEHVVNLRETLAQRGLRRACWGVAVYWFVASMAAAMFVGIGLELHPDKASGGAASASSWMTLMIGLGTAAGSLLVAAVCRERVQLGIVPWGALGMAVGLFAAGWFPASLTAYDVSLVVLGWCSACYMVPVQAHIQDLAEPAKRGRVLASMNLLNSVAGVVSVVALFGLKTGLGLQARGQFWALALLMLAATFVSVRLLPQETIRFAGRALIRALYRVRCRHPERVPTTGAALLLPNHVSYVDALLLATAIERPIRFVIWEPLYKVVWFHWLLRLFGTVPVSPTRAKDAVRSVVQALKEGELVCLFPEGQITRHGTLNELRRGFELMVRQAEVPVVPVWLDGLWGSIFSFSGGRCFSKWPRRLRYPVTVLVGEPLPPAEASAERVRQKLLELGSEGLRERAEDTVERSAPAQRNALRLADTAWHEAGESLWLCDRLEQALAESVLGYAAQARRVRAVRRLVDAPPSPVVALGSVAALRAAAADPLWADRVRRAVVVLSHVTEPVPEDLAAQLKVSVFPAWLDAVSGEWLALAVPDPVMPPGQEGNQIGHRPGSLGRLLPGVTETAIGERGGALTSEGLVVPQTRPSGQPPSPVK